MVTITTYTTNSATYNAQPVYTNQPKPANNANRPANPAKPTPTTAHHASPKQTQPSPTTTSTTNATPTPALIHIILVHQTMSAYNASLHV